MNDQIAYVIAAVGSLVLVVGALLARRLSLSQTMQMAAIWSLIFLGVSILVWGLGLAQ